MTDEKLSFRKEHKFLIDQTQKCKLVNLLSCISINGDSPRCYAIKSIYISTYKSADSSGKLRLRIYMDPKNNDHIHNIFLEEKFKVSSKSSKKRWEISTDTFTKIIQAKTLNIVKSILGELNITISDLYFLDENINFISFQYVRNAFIIKKRADFVYRITIDSDFKYYLKNEEINLANPLTILEIKSDKPLELLELDTDINLFKTKFSKYSYFSNLVNAEQPLSLVQYDGFEDEIKILVSNHQNYYTEMLKALDQYGFILKKFKNKHYNDIYFDPDDDFLYKNNYTYRIRNYISSAENILNFKTPPPPRN
ncbi:MAG: VTC domain-containing protein [Christensenellaceae bacterium]|jgi:adenylate cyclase class IV|nr:VTC domain-containing protein [Christensenellaceae bacterium]